MRTSQAQNEYGLTSYSLPSILVVMGLVKSSASMGSGCLATAEKKASSPARRAELRLASILLASRLAPHRDNSLKRWSVPPLNRSDTLAGQLDSCRLFNMRYWPIMWGHEPRLKALAAKSLNGKTKIPLVLQLLVVPCDIVTIDGAH